jgi:hypothetical protein
MGSSVTNSSLLITESQHLTKSCPPGCHFANLVAQFDMNGTPIRVEYNERSSAKYVRYSEYYVVDKKVYKRYIWIKAEPTQISRENFLQHIQAQIISQRSLHDFTVLKQRIADTLSEVRKGRKDQ